MLHYAEKTIKLSFIVVSSALIDRNEYDDGGGNKGKDHGKIDGFAIHQQHIAKYSPQDGDADGLTI